MPSEQSVHPPWEADAGVAFVAAPPVALRSSDPLVGELGKRVEVRIVDLKIGYCTGWRQPLFRPLERSF